MRVTGSRVYSRPAPVPKMPPGLVELMEGLTRDVLKNNPSDVYEFCADHMLKLLEIRDGSTTKKKLSLEQKISRAQENVKKRAEQRWRKYKEQLQEKSIAEQVRENDISSAADEKTTNEKTSFSLVGPNHDLGVGSEIEIFCESDNHQNHDQDINLKSIKILETSNTNILNDEKNNLIEKNEVEIKQNEEILHQPEELDKQNNIEEKKILEVESDNNANSLDDTKNSLLKHKEGVLEAKQGIEGEIENNHKQKGDQFCEVGTIDKVFPNTSDFKDKLIDENEDKKIPTIICNSYDGKEPNSPVVVSNGCNIDVNENTEKMSTPLIVQDLIKTEGDDDQEKEINKNGEQNVSEHLYDHNQRETKTENDLGLNQFDDMVKNIVSEPNDEPNHNDTHIKDMKEIGNDTNVESKLLLEHTENKSDENVMDSNKTDTVLMTGDEITTDIKLTDNFENEVDLEKVLTEAVENTKIKDSTAFECSKDVNGIEEESDASECSNVVDESMALVESKEHNINLLETCNNQIVKKTDEINITSTEKDIVTEMNDKSDESELSKENEKEYMKNGDSNMILKGETISSDKCNESDGTEATCHNTEEIPSISSGKMAQHDNSNNMNLETAAVTIQKVFRTFLFKSRASTFDETAQDENNLSDDDEKKDERQFMPNNINKERRTLGISRMDTVLQTVNEEKSLSLSTDDSSLSSAATIIQAHVRGFLVRNKLHHGKTTSSNSLAISNERLSSSMDGDVDQNKSKTILNIHIVPEGGNYLSRDESMITSMDLSLDGSPPSSVNLHPLGTSERRKQLKREDAVQSVSPPSNNSGKLSEDVDSVKELTINENECIIHDEKISSMASLVKNGSHQETEVGSPETTPTNSITIETVVEENKTPNTEILSSPEPVTESPEKNRKSLTKQSSDEMDVVTPFKENYSPRDATQKLLHSGEFHDAALPTKVSRSDTSVASGE